MSYQETAFLGREDFPGSFTLATMRVPLQLVPTNEEPFNPKGFINMVLRLKHLLNMNSLGSLHFYITKALGNR